MLIPSCPHPDVAIVKALLEELQPGELLSYASIAAALGARDDDPIVRRRATLARKQLRRVGMNVTAVAKEGLLRETAEQSLSRVQGRERRSIMRKSRKVGEELAATPVADLSDARKAEFFAERTIVNLIYSASSAASHKKVLTAVQQSRDVLPMLSALRVLQNGSHPAAEAHEQ